MPDNKIRILIADDHKLFRQGIALMIESMPEFEIAGHAANGMMVIQSLKNTPVDIILLDIEMPQMNGIETIKHLRKHKDPTPILVLTMHQSLQFVQSVLRAGANGYLPKDSGQSKLKKAILSIIRTGKYIDDEVAKKYMEKMLNRIPNTELSNREIEVIKLIGDQLTTKEVAERMHLSTHTIESHRQNAMLKLGVKNTAGLIKIAVERGLI